MSTEERPPKRPRNDYGSSDASGPPALQRSTDYWFDDGNIILQVESTQFRLAKSVLAMHSSVFRDMFSLPLPQDEPLVDGCPVVILCGDRSEDWTHLLAAVFPLQLFRTRNPTLDQLSAILRLSKKYDIPLPRSDCVRRLKCEFPTTLAEHDQLDTGWMHIEIPGDLSITQALVHLVNLAREVGLFSILPLLLYDIIIAAEPGENDHDNPNVLHHALRKLSTADEIACLRFHVRLMQPYHQTPLKWIESVPCVECTAAPKCSVKIDLLLGLALNAPNALIHEFLTQWDSHDDWSSKVCEKCLIVAKAVHETARQKFWDRLPSFFELPEWEELRKMDFE
ncbi:BTB domain-containing protein [Mycena indigotica]|uniref:BTB domain-containing protein n=1 Tax=Mycena indigotica TaxID=2126181 RepID=A0A8H6SGS2_9AGAR|nr:BTB domain-containing protein [Mycena indigotica]KAF7299315.1 BTB domain-containing protein [Mycena indigotica]